MRPHGDAIPPVVQPVVIPTAADGDTLLQQPLPQPQRPAEQQVIGVGRAYPEAQRRQVICEPSPLRADEGQRPLQKITLRQRTASAVAQLDVLAGFAETALQNNYVMPTVDESGVMQIKEGRHPVIEQMLKGSLFVPNDTLLDEDENRMLLITGPNMAGKSTYMRQNALIALMAQIGSFVPAASAHIGVVDAIFTRVGASDDLAAGQSTFMVEMTEVAEILKNATKDSLVILDEIGRGTSTFDGMSIARSVVEFICENIGC